MKKHLLIALSLVCVMPLAVHAGEEEDKLIDQVVAAYGGDAVANLSSYRIESSFLNPTTGQSNVPSLTEVSTSKSVLMVDAKNNKGVTDGWNEGRSGGFQNAVVSDGEKGYTINYQAGTYGEAGNADPHVFAGGTMRSTDVILVHELSKIKDKATIGEDQMYMNRLHHTITMPFPSSPDLTLFIDAETFLVSKMLRVNPQLGNLDYAFSEYKKQNGVSYASGFIFSIAGDPNIISVSRDMTFNFPVSDDMFTLPEGLTEEGTRIDTSEMLVNKISNNVYHVGQGGGFSMFVDTSMGAIGVGGYPALPARFSRYQEESDNYKPLTYQIVTHHHSDHLGGMAEAVALGAKLVTVSANVQEIKDATNPEPSDRDFYTVGKRTSFGEGRSRVDVYEVSTIHSAGFLVTYVPADKVVFIADHMGSPFADAVPVANPNTVDMLKALDSLEIDIKKIATAHNARIFTMKDMRDSVAAFQPSVCAGDRPVCL